MAVGHHRENCENLLRITIVIRSRYPSFYAAMKGSGTSGTLRLPP